MSAVTFRWKAVSENLDTHVQTYGSPHQNNDWWQPAHRVSRGGTGHAPMGEKAFQFCLFFQSTDISPVSACFSSFLIKKLTKLGANANKQPSYLCVNSPASPQKSEAVQDLAGAWSYVLRGFLQDSTASCLSASAVLSLGHQDWFSFSLQVKVQSVCPCLLPRETNNATTRSTWKTHPGKPCFHLCFSLS